MTESAPPDDRQRSCGGFSLVEVAISIAILSVALLLGMSLILGQARYVHRLDADHAARTALAATLEAIRSGALPLRAGHFDGGDLAAAFGSTGAAGSADGLTIDLDVTPAAPPGLYEVALRARYQIAGQPLERRLGSMVWQPPPAAP
jgi:prepilin-type N-terminal cleavage/methylation domain-containing protein